MHDGKEMDAIELRDMEVQPLSVLPWKSLVSLASEHIFAKMHEMLGLAMIWC